MNFEAGQLTIPAIPPPEVLDEVAAAWERAVQLAEQDLELHFARDDATGRPIVELRTLSGELVKTISAAQALEIVAGRPPSAFIAA